MITLIKTDPGKLMEMIDKAKGTVFLITDEGDKINMKSKLSQLYGVRMLLELAKDGKITASLECEDPDDTVMFFDYLMKDQEQA